MSVTVSRRQHSDQPPDPAQEQRALATAAARLASEFPDVTVDRISAYLHGAYAETAEAPVQTFREVLAERAARERLTADHQTSSGTGSNDTYAI